MTKIYKINYYLSLKLEGNITQIYVKNKRFSQCKYLLFDIALDDIESYDEIKSIDDLVVEESAHRTSPNILPHQEFWGHCSNLQAWYEHGYDTRLLHRNLAFPLLKALSKAGDPKAKQVFKEEIFMRFEEGNSVVREYLFEEGYTEEFTLEELQSLYDILNKTPEPKYPIGNTARKYMAWRIKVKLRKKQQEKASQMSCSKIVQLIYAKKFYLTDSFVYFKFIRRFLYQDLKRILKAHEKGIFKLPNLRKFKAVLEEKEREYLRDRRVYIPLDRWIYPERIGQ